MDETGGLPQGLPLNMLPPTPAGLEALYALCRKIYPDQINPLQVTALLKYWLGGPDPLDYISMYANQGDSQQNIPPHWHYISFGLSDLHGDGRVHDVTGTDGISGFGFELTFRLKREPNETVPPTWPATLMQSLAKYVFQSGNTLCAGDHVSWHCALDNSESRMQHMLMASDPQLSSTRTPFGCVDFVQVVGVCADELKAAQQWNGTGVLNMLANLPTSGGTWHITDMRRGESIFEYDPNSHEIFERGFEMDGSNLSGVSARCSWTASSTGLQGVGGASHAPTNRGGLQSSSTSTSNSMMMMRLSEEEAEQIKNTLQKGLLQSVSATRGPTGGTLESQELMLHVKKLDGVEMVFNLEAGSLLPLAIRGRVKHGRHFTFKSVLGETAITLVAASVTGTLVSQENPYVAQGSWLQVLIPDDLAADMSATFQILANPEVLSLPKMFTWPDRKLSITIVADKIQ